MNVADAIQGANERLAAANVKEPLRDAKLLLAWAIERNSTFLIAHPEYELTVADEAKFEDAVARRLEHVPIQHITGIQEFFGLTFKVSPGVLIPRPETEIIVEKAVEHLREINEPRFCEIGVGSGCISISVLKNLPRATAIGVDLSDAAIECTQMNATELQVADRLDLRRSDLLENVSKDGFDAILSNPPYVPMNEYLSLDREVLEHEPKMALTDGGDGLSLIERIISGSRHKLRPGGVLILEIGFGQADSVKRLMSNESDDVWRSFEIIDDLQSIPRTLVAIRE